MNMRRSIKITLINILTGALLFAAAFADKAMAADIVIDPAAVLYALPQTEAIPQTETLPQTDAMPAQPDVMIPPVADPVDVFLSQSAFVGNSVGEGLTLYNNAKKKVPLSNAVMLTRVSYSFYADANRVSKFIPKLNGVAMPAREAIRLSGVRYAFICMGTNDLVGSSTPEGAFAKYQQYLAGIMTENPGVILFIESCTPTRPGSNVNNDKVAKFNMYTQAYCNNFPNMFYVDIATPLTGPDGFLNAALSSDGSVHLTNKAYAIWADTVRAYITAFLQARTVAILERQESEIEKDRQNYIKNMKEVEKKQQAARQARIVAEQKEKELEEAQRRERLLNVPDEVTLMRTLASLGRQITPPDSQPLPLQLSLQPDLP